MKVRNIFQTCQKCTIKTRTTVFNNLAVFAEVYKIILGEDSNYLDASAQPFCATIDFQVYRHVPYNK